MLGEQTACRCGAAARPSHRSLFLHSRFARFVGDTLEISQRDAAVAWPTASAIRSGPLNLRTRLRLSSRSSSRPARRVRPARCARAPTKSPRGRLRPKDLSLVPQLARARSPRPQNLLRIPFLRHVLIPFSNKYGASLLWYRGACGLQAPMMVPNYTSRSYGYPADGRYHPEPRDDVVHQQRRSPRHEAGCCCQGAPRARPFARACSRDARAHPRRLLQRLKTESLDIPLLERPRQEGRLCGDHRRLRPGGVQLGRHQEGRVAHR